MLSSNAKIDLLPHPHPAKANNSESPSKSIQNPLSFNKNCFGVWQLRQPGSKLCSFWSTKIFTVISRPLYCLNFSPESRVRLSSVLQWFGCMSRRYPGVSGSGWRFVWNVSWRQDQFVVNTLSTQIPCGYRNNTYSTARVSHPVMVPREEGPPCVLLVFPAWELFASTNPWIWVYFLLFGFGALPKEGHLDLPQRVSQASTFSVLVPHNTTVTMF